MDSRRTWIRGDVFKMIVLSMKDLLKKIHDLLWKDEERAELIIEKVTGYGVNFPKEEEDIVWCYVDGLAQKRLDDLMNGRCSLQATIDFDIGEEEDRLREHYVIIASVIKRLEE